MNRKGEAQVESLPSDGSKTSIYLLYVREGTLGHRHFAHMPESCRTTGNAGRCMRKAKDNALLSVLATLVEVGSTTFFTGSDISIDVKVQVRRLWGSGDKRSRWLEPYMTGGLAGHRKKRFPRLKAVPRCRVWPGLMGVRAQRYEARSWGRDGATREWRRPYKQVLLL